MRLPIRLRAQSVGAVRRTGRTTTHQIEQGHSGEPQRKRAGPARSHRVRQVVGPALLAGQHAVTPSHPSGREGCIKLQPALLRSVESLLTSLVAVVGTLLGVAASQVVQLRTAARSEKFQRAERLRQDRMAAVKSLAQALHEYRRGQGERWHHGRREWDGPEAVAARMESYRLGGAAREALSQAVLLFNEGDVRGARAAFELASGMHLAEDLAQLNEWDAAVREAIDSYLTEIAQHVQ